MEANFSHNGVIKFNIISKNEDFLFYTDSSHINSEGASAVLHEIISVVQEFM